MSDEKHIPETTVSQRCQDCRHFAPLLVRHGAGICHFKWRGLPWNAAVPLTTAHESCEAFDERADAKAA